tara:strand:- start:86 stop:238 length:153 start_codon:yes stop_codon:yes gene_type:complete
VNVVALNAIAAVVIVAVQMTVSIAIVVSQIVPKNQKIVFVNNFKKSSVNI